MNLQLKRKVSEARNVMWFDFSWKTQISLFHGQLLTFIFVSMIGGRGTPGPFSWIRYCDYPLPLNFKLPYVINL